MIDILYETCILPFRDDRLWLSVLKVLRCVSQQLDRDKALIEKPTGCLHLEETACHWTQKKLGPLFEAPTERRTRLPVSQLPAALARYSSTLLSLGPEVARSVGPRSLHKASFHTRPSRCQRCQEPSCPGRARVSAPAQDRDEGPGPSQAAGVLPYLGSLAPRSLTCPTRSEPDFRNPWSGIPKFLGFLFKEADVRPKAS